MDKDNALPSKPQIYKTSFDMAWPAILESFLLAMTGFVDNIMVSSQGDAAIAAVGLTVQPKFIGLAIFVSMSVAVSSIVARRKGEQDKHSANRVLKISLLIVVIGSVIISSIYLFFGENLMYLAGANADTIGISTQYLKIVMGGMIFNTVTIIINASQRGSGNTRISMVTNLTSNIVNVLFNFLLINGNFGFPALGVKGAAIATVIGSAVACGMSIRSVFKKGSFMYIRQFKGIIPNKKDVKSMISIGLSAFCEQFFLRVGFFLFALTVASLGTIQTTTHMITMNFMHISFSFADGLAVASVALVGRSLGEKRPDLAKIYGSACQKIGILCSIVVSLFFVIFGKQMFSLFTDTPEVLEQGMVLLYILCVVLVLQIQQVAIIGCLRGAGDTKYTALISLVSVAIIRPFASWLLCYPLGLGLFGVWMGLFIDQTLRFLMGFIRYRQGKWLNIKI